MAAEHFTACRRHPLNASDCGASLIVPAASTEWIASVSAGTWPRPRILRSNVSGATVRDASEDDASVCAAIYAPYVRETAVSFEGEPPSPAQMTERIAVAMSTHAWVVLEDDDRLVGYAYAGSGRALYEALFERLAARGYRMAVAGMTLPNEASVGLHRAMGFEPVGVYRRIGWKFAAWHDVAWMQRTLGVEQDPPPEPH